MNTSPAAMAAYTAAFLAAAAPAAAAAAAAAPAPRPLVAVHQLASEEGKEAVAAHSNGVISSATADRSISRAAADAVVRAVLQSKAAAAASAPAASSSAAAPAAAAAAVSSTRHSPRFAAAAAAASAAASSSSSAAAAAAASPRASDATSSGEAAMADVQYEEDAQGDSLFFKAPSGGLVHNKPFSLELRGAVYSASASDSASLSSAAPLCTLRFNLAVKVSERAMEKRTNTYEPIKAVWIKAADSASATSDAEKSAASLLTIAGLADRAGATDVDSAPSSPMSSSSEMAASRLLKRSCNVSSKTSDRKPQHVQCAPTPLSRLTKTAREKARDRTIGQAPIITTEPAAALMASSAARSLANLQTKLFVRITAVKQVDKRGLLTLVTTKGGNIRARPSQRYILIQAGFGYKILLPRMPAGYAIHFSSLQLRSWEQAITPIPLLNSPRLLSLYPTIKPKPRKTSRRRGGKRTATAAASVVSDGDSNSSYNGNGDSKPGAATAAAAPVIRAPRLRPQKKKRASSASSSDTESDGVMSDLTDGSEDEGSSRRKGKQKKTKPKRNLAAAAEGAVPSLGPLPMRHNRSLTALLQATVDDAETTKAGGGLLLGTTKFDSGRKRPAPATRDERGNGAASASAAAAATSGLSPAARVVAATQAVIAAVTAGAIASSAKKQQRKKKQRTEASAADSYSSGSSAAAAAAASASSMMDASPAAMPSFLSVPDLSNSPAWGQLAPFLLASTHRALEDLPPQSQSLLQSHLPAHLQIHVQPSSSSSQQQQHHTSTETEFPPPASPVPRSLHHLSSIALGGSGSSNRSISSYRGSGSGAGREMLALSPHPQTPPHSSPQPPHASVSPPRMLGLSRHAHSAAASGSLSPHHHRAAAASSSHFAPSAASSSSFTFAGAYRAQPLTPNGCAAAASSSHHLQQQPPARSPFDSASPPAPRSHHQLPLLASPLPPAHQPDPASPHQTMQQMGSSTPPLMPMHPLHAPHTPMVQLDIGDAATNSTAAQACTENFLN